MNTNNITEGPIWKNMLRYFWALLLGAFFQQFYNTIDAVIVGRAVGSDALGAVGGSAAMLVNLFVGFFIGLSSGATVVISQFYGAERKEEVHKAVHTAIALSATGGLLFSVIGFLASPWLIEVMNTPVEQKAAATIYLKIFFIGMIPNLVYNMGSGILRAAGDSRRPLIVLIISSVVNIFLDVLFVIVLGLGDMGVWQGVMGVAIATVLCQLLSAIIVIRMLQRSEDSYRLSIRKVRFDRIMLGRIVRIGLPAGLQATMYSLSNVLIQASFNSFGSDTASAWAAYGKIDVIFWMTMNSLCTAITTFVGQNYGAGNYKRVRNSTRQAAFIAVAIAVPLSAFLYIFGENLLRIFIKSEENVISIGYQMIKFLAPFYITYIGVEIFSGTLRGMGDALMPMIITFSGICVLRVVWILAVFPHNPTLEMLEKSYPITWITTTILYSIYYIYYINKHKIR